MAAEDSRLYAREPPSPPIVAMAGSASVGHLLCWEQHERDGSWHAWVSWVNSVGDPVRHQHLVVSQLASSVRPLEAPEAYEHVPRRTLGKDGKIRPWTPPTQPGK